MPTYHFIPVDSVLCSAHAKFKFCFLDLLGFFFFFSEYFQSMVGGNHRCKPHGYGGPTVVGCDMSTHPVACTYFVPKSCVLSLYKKIYRQHAAQTKTKAHMGIRPSLL